jgi:hypothetical protein
VRARKQRFLSLSHPPTNVVPARIVEAFQKHKSFRSLGHDRLPGYPLCGGMLVQMSAGMLPETSAAIK